MAESWGQSPLNLFYSEPDPDRWLPLDRYPRRVIRRIVRGRPRAGGQAQVFASLCAGLTKLGIQYRVNDYAHARRNPDEAVGIVGKPHVLDQVQWENPILFGAAVFSHPVDDPDLLERLPVRRILVPGEWARRMFQPYYGDRVRAWPAGIDTDYWSPDLTCKRDIDVLIYEKLLWNRDQACADLLEPLVTGLHRRGLNTAILHYGSYDRAQLRSLARRCRRMIFLSRHETQGLAYQQVLACDVPVIAYDPGGCWPDPSYYPDRVKFAPVSSVPYWDSRCGERCRSLEEIEFAVDSTLRVERYAPRSYILENLTIEHSAREYSLHMQAVMNSVSPKP
jgi:hypothetical protein